MIIEYIFDCQMLKTLDMNYFIKIIAHDLKFFIIYILFSYIPVNTQAEQGKMDTTLNIRTDISEKLAMAARSMGISRSEIIALLIKKVMDDISNPGRFGQLVRYQTRRSRDEWHTFHLYVREDDYEYFLDLRRLLKMSVSLILAYAVEKFLDILLKRNGTDNNRFKNYIIAKEFIDNIICWKFIWGFPPNINKLFDNE